MEDVGGVMSMNATQNPLFAAWSKVLIKYCDGSSFSSRREGPVAVGSEQIWYRGRPNLDAVISELLGDHGLGSAKEVFLSGTSAGGLAVYYNLDYVASLLPSGTRVTGFADAGYFADLQNTAGEYKYRSNFQSADPSWNTTGGGGTNMACLQHNSDAPWKCLMAQYIVPHLKADIFVMNAALDVYQVHEILAVGCFPNLALLPNSTRWRNTARNS
jgi:hypothetical protein